MGGGGDEWFVPKNDSRKRREEAGRVAGVGEGIWGGEKARTGLANGWKSGSWASRR